MPPPPVCRRCPTTAAYGLASIKADATACREHLCELLDELLRGDSPYSISVWRVGVELDDATRPFPPLRETVLRRPPVPAAKPITELSGAELVRALYDELGAELAELHDDNGAGRDDQHYADREDDLR